jgi:hypothetical protein
MEQPVQSERKVSGLEKKAAEYQAELDEVEAKIERVKQLQTIASGFETSRALLADFEGSEEVVESVEASITAIKDFEEMQGLTGLLERRRQVKQLIVTGKMDLAASSPEQE